MRRGIQFGVLLLLLSCVPVLYSQAPVGVTTSAETPGKSAPPSLGSPRITFTFEFPEADPPHYVLKIDAAGQAAYQSVDRNTRQAGDWESFTVSAATRDRIFALARDTGYFVGNFDYRKSRIAFTGSKTLTYESGSIGHSTTVNWSENANITALLAIFQGISSTVEAGDRLRYLRKYDRLGLNEYLANLEKQANLGWLKEIHVIKDALEQVVQDRNAMEMAKRRAQHLLDLAEQGR